jgi:hypothetical protein
MSDHPHVLALLTRLCDLDEADAQLPLDILVNLHRRRLAEPYEGLLFFAADHVGLHTSEKDRLAPLKAELLRRYPTWNEDVFAEHDELDTLDKVARVEIGNTSDEMEEIEEANGIGSMLFTAYDINFEPHEPVLLLLQLTWPLSPEMRANRLRALEIELAEEAVSMPLILDMAALAYRPTAIG